MPAYHRTQILLEPEQHAALTELAAEEARSVSAIMRETVDRLLDERGRERKKQKALAALEQAAIFRKALAKKYPNASFDPVIEKQAAYDEQVENWERIWAGDE